MDTKDIIELVNLFSQKNLKSLNLSKGDFSLELEKESVGQIASNLENIQLEAKSFQEPEEKGEDYYQLKSILTGIYFQAPSPEAEPFVKEGDSVNEGDTLCIIEAMKMINEIKAPVSGIIKKIHFENEELVQYDDIIMEIEENV